LEYYSNSLSKRQCGSTFLISGCEHQCKWSQEAFGSMSIGKLHLRGKAVLPAASGRALAREWFGELHYVRALTYLRRSNSVPSRQSEVRPFTCSIRYSLHSPPIHQPLTENAFWGPGEMSFDGPMDEQTLSDHNVDLCKDGSLFHMAHPNPPRGHLFHDSTVALAKSASPPWINRRRQERGSLTARSTSTSSLKGRIGYIK
jgi:hypothetical protein